MGAPRNAGLDVLRAATTALVVFHHTMITYGGSGGWYYRERPAGLDGTSQLLSFLCAVNQAWFMGLFFLLAGYFTPPAVDRDGAFGFGRNRLVRLGLPLVAYGVLIGPATVALAATARGRDFTETLVGLWRRGSFETGPLWFAETLLIFAAAYLGWRALAQRHQTRRDRPFPSDAALLVAALATGAAAFALRLAWPVGTTVFALQLGYFASYVLLFAVGCIAAGQHWLDRIPPDVARRWRRFAWVTLPVLPVAAIAGRHVPALAGAFSGGANPSALIYALWEPFLAWGILLTLIAVFQRRFEAPGEFGKRAARRAYLVYVIHPPVVVSVALAWRTIAAPALVKVPITGGVACLACYALAGLMLRSRVVRAVV